MPSSPLLPHLLTPHAMRQPGRWFHSVSAPPASHVASSCRPSCSATLDDTRSDPFRQFGALALLTIIACKQTNKGDPTRAADEQQWEQWQAPAAAQIAHTGRRASACISKRTIPSSSGRYGGEGRRHTSRCCPHRLTELPSPSHSYFLLYAAACKVQNPQMDNAGGGRGLAAEQGDKSCAARLLPQSARLPGHQASVCASTRRCRPRDRFMQRRADQP